MGRDEHFFKKGQKRPQRSAGRPRYQSQPQSRSVYLSIGDLGSWTSAINRLDGHHYEYKHGYKQVYPYDLQNEYNRKLGPSQKENPTTTSNNIVNQITDTDTNTNAHPGRESGPPLRRFLPLWRTGRRIAPPDAGRGDQANFPPDHPGYRYRCRYRCECEVGLSGGTAARCGMDGRADSRVSEDGG